MEKKTYIPSTSDRLEDAQRICAGRGKRLTSTRIKVLSIFLEQGRALKAYDILELMQKVHTGAKPATVYRALDFLEKEYFIHRIDSLNAWIASSNWDDENQGLLIVCTSCGKVHEIIAPSFTKQLVKQVNQSEFTLGRRQPEIRAICSDCKTLDISEAIYNVGSVKEESPKKHPPKEAKKAV